MPFASKKKAKSAAQLASLQPAACRDARVEARSTAPALGTRARAEAAEISAHQARISREPDDSTPAKRRKSLDVHGMYADGAKSAPYSQLGGKTATNRSLTRDVNRVTELVRKLAPS